MNVAMYGSLKSNDKRCWPDVGPTFIDVCPTLGQRTVLLEILSDLQKENCWTAAYLYI